jgi:urea transport system permease protein
VSFPEYWLFFLGLLFIVVTLMLPKGLVGLWQTLREKLQQNTQARYATQGEK